LGLERHGAITLLEREVRIFTTHGSAPVVTEPWSITAPGEFSHGAGSNAMPALDGSVGVGRDDLAAVSGPECPPCLHVDRGFDESCATVAEQHVGAAGVVAGDGLVLPIGGIRVDAAPAEGAPAKRVLGRGGWDDRIDEAEPAQVLAPPESLLVIDLRGFWL